MEVAGGADANDNADDADKPPATDGAGDKAPPTVQ
jgi:hypothetical protein